MADQTTHRTSADTGHAELHLTLKDGRITVRHGFAFRKKDQADDQVLLEVATTGDSWNQIWAAIRSSGEIQ